MALYNLPDGIDVKVWPDLGVGLIGQQFWSVDNVAPNERITNLILAQTVSMTVTARLSSMGLTGGDQTTFTLGLRHFDSLDVIQALSIQSTFVNRDVDEIGINVAMIVLPKADDYFDLLIQQDGIAAGLTNVDIITAFQFWTLDVAL